MAGYKAVKKSGDVKADFDHYPQKFIRVQNGLDWEGS